MSDETPAPGWDAIDAALDQLYPGVEPLHLATIVKRREGGPDPLDGISIYRRPDHWHLISYGLTELYTKESANLDHSGWGFELTIRVARGPDDVEPIWAANVLQNLARYVFDTGNLFGPGHHIGLNSPINLDRPDTAIRAVAFALDPTLGPRDTPHGRVEFLQLVGITIDEYDTCRSWSTAQLLDLYQRRSPLLLTDLDRPSILDDPAMAAEVEAGVRRDGSKTTSLAVDALGWVHAGDRTVLTLGALAAPGIATTLGGRLPHDRDLAVESRARRLRFVPAAAPKVDEIDDATLEIALSPAAVVELIEVLRPVAGVYPLSTVPGLTIEITRTQIRDASGAVTDEIG